jgi:hypothetical protein
MMIISIDRALSDRKLLGAALGDISTWQVWLAILKAAFGLPLTSDEQTIFGSVSGDRAPPNKRVRELWVAAGRRGGKSRIAAALAVYFACFVKHRLSSGETGMVLVLAASTEQAKVVFAYALAFLNASPVLRKEISNTTRSEIRLRNGISIAIHANSFRSVRGRTLCAVCFDEIAYWRDDTSATPDAETYTAVLPSLLTTNGMLVGISSPYRRTGLLHSKHKRYYGEDSDDTLFVQGASKQFNQTLDDTAITAQQEADPTAARSEWLAEFRADISTFLDDELIDFAVDRDRPIELPPRSGTYYRAFVDVSAGAIGGDAYSIAIVHKHDGRFIVDAIRGRFGPFEPAELTKEYVALLKDYHISGVTGDYYAAEWMTSVWRSNGIVYQKSPLTASQLYLETLPLFTRGLVKLPDHPGLLRELRLLERMPTRLGKDQVTHPRGCHDDLANACCGALRSISNYLGYCITGNAFSAEDDDSDSEAAKEARDQAYRNEFAMRIFRLSGGQCYPR